MPVGSSEKEEVMNYRLGKAGIILILGGISVALTGCLMGDSAEAPVVSTSPPPPPPPPPTNQAPTISGTPPPAVVVGDTYSFTPTALDPDVDDTLIFSIVNKPSWADFDTATGTLSGVAAQGTEGTYADIGISVSDGELSASLPRFAVEVTQVALGSAMLSWTPPTQNTDGSTLMDLDAYKIYYGTSPGSYPNQIYIDNEGLSSYVVEDLVPDTYYFVATAINSAGVESSFSNMASKTVTAN
jgi:hypothetical protein